MEPNDLINSLKECKAIKFGRFVLTSGAVSDYYIDIKKPLYLDLVRGLARDEDM